MTKRDEITANFKNRLEIANKICNQMFDEMRTGRRGWVVVKELAKMTGLFSPEQVRMIAEKEGFRITKQGRYGIVIGK